MTLQDLVFRALDNHPHLYKPTTDSLDDVAINLLAYDVEIDELCRRSSEAVAVMDLIPIIEEWRKQNVRLR